MYVVIAKLEPDVDFDLRNNPKSETELELERRNGEVTFYGFATNVSQPVEVMHFDDRGNKINRKKETLYDGNITQVPIDTRT
jgi:hypothetical protein